MRLHWLAFVCLCGVLSACEGESGWTCQNALWTPGACVAPEVVFEASSSRGHVDGEIDYPTDPPSSGNHNAQWARWGEYEYLPPQHWLHNLEHGGAALLVHPCAQDDLVGALREAARSRPDDDGGAFRWILSPYIDLPSAIAVVTWEWTWSAECLDSDALDSFLADHYRQAPEDVAVDGAFEELWLGL